MGVLCVIWYAIICLCWIDSFIVRVFLAVVFIEIKFLLALRKSPSACQYGDGEMKSAQNRAQSAGRQAGSLDCISYPLSRDAQHGPFAHVFGGAFLFPAVCLDKSAGRRNGSYARNRLGWQNYFCN